MVDPDLIIRISKEVGADFADARIQEYRYETILMDNGVIRELSTNYVRGIGIRVIVGGSAGYSSTTSTSLEDLREAARRAYKIAKAIAGRSVEVKLSERPTSKDKVLSRYVKDPDEVDVAEKVEVLKLMNSVARDSPEISSAILRLASEMDRRIYISTNGDFVDFTRRMVGVAMSLVANVEGKMESLNDSDSAVSGWEFVEGIDWGSWAKERGDLAIRAASAPHVQPGKYDIILDNDMVGLMLHEAFGHASEGDIVASGGSVLGQLIGKPIASELVSVIDDGLIEGGVYVPYDDEGTPKRKVYTVHKGVLRGYLHSLSTAKELGGQPTGNARVMSYRHPILVRQTNTYMEPGDWKPDEIIRDTRKGIYVKGRGAQGGEVNPLTGAFTFTSGPSYLIEEGEVTKLVRGVMLSGLILDALKKVDAVGSDLVVRTSVFGGCGKSGQMVRVGDGGPHVRVRDFTIGGG